jgi:hypothetical protein
MLTETEIPEWILNPPILRCDKGREFQITSDVHDIHEIIRFISPYGYSGGVQETYVWKFDKIVDEDAYWLRKDDFGSLLMLKIPLYGTFLPHRGSFSISIDDDGEWNRIDYGLFK